ncbi:MAG: translation elongation factor Ts [Candidatus Auribacterota bacterium]|jgi:elongation factor Ts|uniref:Elongation factor Ts n=1 Tax=Candidatus Auribacter fodinae TaxID=2093366 RepID=A0A3A4R466_9BACT|nr:MAG: translation elongation factor Ts [Candidatus Auribacter fodinae]
MSITAQAVKELRDITNAGMMDCKKALTEAGGDMEKAVELLRKRGVALAEKKSGRATNQGLIDSYIHLGSKVGVMIEVNCETDFVARNEVFRTFVKDLMLQIASLSPICVGPEDVPANLIEREKDIARAQIAGKPENIVEKIVEGKVNKYFEQVCLLKQPFVKDDKMTIEQLLKAKIAEIGENIIIRRFVRYQLGEEV